MSSLQALAGMALVALLGAGSALPAYSDVDTPPVTHPDEMSMLPNDQAFADVLANDSDDHYDLAVCRARADSSAPISAHGGGQLASVSSGEVLGTFTVQYQACDHDFLSVGELTVHVVAPQSVTVEKVPGSPGLLRATNPNPADLRFEWSHQPNFYDGPIDGSFDLPAESSATFEVGLQTIYWQASDENSSDANVWSGSVTDILVQPLASTARAPSRVTFRQLSPLLGSTDSSNDPGATAAARGGSDPTSTDPWPVDPTTVARPVTQPDDVDMWTGGITTFDVLANDTDPQGEPLELCREVTSPAGMSAFQEDGRIGVLAERLDKDKSPGTYPVYFNVCNSGRMSPGVLTVHLRLAAPMTARRLRKRPGRARLHNPNPDSIWYSIQVPDGATIRTGRIPPSGTTTIAVPRTRLHWMARIGVESGDAGKGHLDRVR